MPRRYKFMTVLHELRTLNPTFTAYDAAVLVSCVRAMQESAEVAENTVQAAARGVSMAIVTHYIAHRECAERICVKYGLAYIAPNVVHLHGRTDMRFEIPSLKSVPTLDVVAKRDWNR